MTATTAVTATVTASPRGTRTPFLMASSSFISPSAQLVPSTSPTPTSGPPPTPHQSPPSSPTPPFPTATPLPSPPSHPSSLPFSSLLSSIVSVCDVLLHLFFTLFAAFILSLRQRLAVLIAPIRSTYAGHLLSVLFYAAVPLPLSPETLYAPPFPLAGSNSPDDRELAANGHPADVANRLSLYTPVGARRLRKHTVSNGRLALVSA